MGNEVVDTPDAEGKKQMFDIDQISIFVTDEHADIVNHRETADLDLLILLHDNVTGISYKYGVSVECNHRDDWCIYSVTSENGRVDEYPPFECMEERIEKMIRLFLGDFRPYFNRAIEAQTEGYE